MDLGQLATSNLAQVGAKISLLSPIDGTLLEHDGKQMFVEILGVDSPEYKKAIAHAMAKKGNGNSAASVDNENKKTAHVLSKVTTNACIFENGQWVEYKSTEELFDFYIRFDWSIAQIWKEVQDRANFFREAQEET